MLIFSTEFLDGKAFKNWPYMEKFHKCIIATSLEFLLLFFLPKSVLHGEQATFSAENISWSTQNYKAATVKIT